MAQAVSQAVPVRAVFLDRDGVINENRTDHVKSWEEFQFLPGACEAVARLSEAGLRVFVVTNQAIVRRGIVSHHAVEAINQRMIQEIEHHGGRIECVAYCPHRPEERCSCRKPQPGLLIDTARSHGLDVRQAVVIGDALTDIEAGEAIGCPTILVLTGRGQDEYARAVAANRNGFAVASDLNGAVDLVLGRTSEAITED